jgi:acetyl-CoA carboxylase carboxyltransferase component
MISSFSAYKIPKILIIDFNGTAGASEQVMGGKWILKK